MEEDISDSSNGSNGGIRTIYDIAEMAGVSPATVSLVLNNKGNIKEETRARIKDLAKRYKYTPNLLARRLRKQKTNSFGVIIDHFHNSFFNAVFDGIESVADPLGYSLLAAESREDYEKEKRELSLLLNHGVDGLILFPCSRKYSHILSMQQQNSVPIVLIGNTFGKHIFPEVVADNRTGGLKATEKLISLNRFPILHIAGPQQQSLCRERKEAFIEAITAKKPNIDPVKYIFGTSDLSIEEGYNAAVAIAKRFRPPYSIFVVNDRTALGVIKYCKRNSLRIPEDISLVGFSDIELLDELDIGLTSVKIPGREMGRRAASLLLACTDKNSPGCKYQRVVLPVQLVERHSTDIKVTKTAGKKNRV